MRTAFYHEDILHIRRQGSDPRMRADIVDLVVSILDEGDDVLGSSFGKQK